MQTLNEWLDLWEREYKEGSVRESTARMYRDSNRRFAGYAIGALPLDQITEDALQKTLAEMCRDGYSKSTISKARISLRQAFRAAYRRGLVTADPTPALKIPTQAPTKIVRPLSIAEEAAVKKAALVDPAGAPVRFLLLTGLRIGELFALRWSDYDAAERSIYIRESKTDAGIREVPLFREAARIIEAQPRTCQHIFTNSKGDPLTRSSFRRTLDRIQNAAGISHLAAHQLRHTFVTRLCEKGIPLKAIAQLVGHTDTQMILRVYAEHEKKTLRQFIEQIDPEKGKKPQVGRPSLFVPLHRLRRKDKQTEGKRPGTALTQAPSFLPVE